MNIHEKYESKWPMLLKSIKDVVGDKPINKSEVYQLLSAYKSEEDDWTEYVFFDENCYTRNLVDAGNGKYNLMILAWNAGQGTDIHNHANSSCFVKILSGALREIRYETPNEHQELRAIESSVRKRDDVFYIEDSMGVHEMVNDTENQAISLHLYIPPFDTMSVYDRDTAVATLGSMSFWSIYGVLYGADRSKKYEEAHEEAPVEFL